MTGPRIDIGELAAMTTRPPVFSRGCDLWRDPHVSGEMLKAHLDPTTDAASRRPESIDQTVNWLVEYLELKSGDRVLDLGCGPGLYCEQLARRGLSVTGMDFSSGSVDYAAESARKKGLDIGYVCRDYLTMDFRDQFDAILLIYYDLGALSCSERDALLDRIASALKPGGRFVFDVQTPASRREDQAIWHICDGPGFWSPSPHLVLTQSLHYRENQALLSQYTVIDDRGPRVFRVWDRLYELDEITSILGRHGLEVVFAGSDLMGRPVESGARSLGVVAVRA